MLSKWYHPNWSGDFRLEAAGEDDCVLRITDPTIDEITKLGKFLDKCRKKEWIGKATGLPEKFEGEYVLEIKAPVDKAGRALVGWGQGLKRKDLLTVVKSVDGAVSYAVSNEEELRRVVEAEKADKAVSNKRATLSCPHPISGPDVRASEVLREFCTQRQWDDWNTYGFLIAYGNLTGHPYRICHRHSLLARRQGKITKDLKDDTIIHAYDWSLPPAEEVLSLKLQLEHVEHWIRNPSGYFGLGVRFVNPFMGPDDQYGDGVPDTAVLSSLGVALPALIGQLSGRNK
ncbi:MAG: hypothetical protein ABIF77_00085 [bacterium]